MQMTQPTTKATREALADAFKSCIQTAPFEQKAALFDALMQYRSVRKGPVEHQAFRLQTMGKMFFKAMDDALPEFEKSKASRVA
jgi:hypothetical protein